MIFLSHNSKDKPIVDEIAKILHSKYGQDNIFYDSWSIQPGDSIIDKMNEGLTKCKYFLFFISKNSLTSEMVKLEWQSALLKKAKEPITFIPIRIDDSMIPQIITQLLYIDLYTNGKDVAITQIINVLDGTNNYIPKSQFQNVIAHTKKDTNSIIIEFRAEYYLEPHPDFLIILDNKKSDIKFSVLSHNEYISGFNENITFNIGKYNCQLVKLSEVISPGFPLMVKLEKVGTKDIDIKGILKNKSVKEGYWGIPIKEDLV